ncbi:MAG TPA: hypothetical protein VKY65_14645 [Alphaproteobacteria bacterium]|nr:hypothetical protein [Alphaproteobacteria bacterium]
MSKKPRNIASVEEVADPSAQESQPVEDILTEPGSIYTANAEREFQKTMQEIVEHQRSTIVTRR